VFISVTFSTTRLAVDFVGTLLVASLSISFFCADLADSQAAMVDRDKERDSEVWRVWKAETTATQDPRLSLGEMGNWVSGTGYPGMIEKIFNFVGAAHLFSPYSVIKFSHFGS
jgi:hypothetical protein